MIAASSLTMQEKKTMQIYFQKGLSVGTAK